MIFVCQGGRRDRPWPVRTGGGCRDVLAKRLYKHCVPPKFYENNAEFPPEFFRRKKPIVFASLRGGGTTTKQSPAITNKKTATSLAPLSPRSDAEAFCHSCESRNLLPLTNYSLNIHKAVLR